MSSDEVDADTRPSGSDLNPLSCLACKKRKIRCNRKNPTCGRCVDRRIRCQYPQRARRSTIRSVDHHRPSESASSGQATASQLNAILDRLLEIERTRTGNTPSGRQEQSNEPSSTETADCTGEHGFRGWRAVTAGSGPVTGSSASTSRQMLREPHDRPRPGSLTLTSPGFTSAIGLTDATECLKIAMDHTQMLRLQTISRLSLTEALHLPQDLARSCLQKFFEVPPIDMFLSFTNVDLIKLVPDLIDMPDVTLRPVILVLYFTILHHAVCMPDLHSFQDRERELDYPTLLYTGALRSMPAWQREATGTKMDFAAAILMALTACEHFDFDMTWRMFELASKYAENLHLHRLDMDTAAGDGIAKDDERRSLWDLIGKDLFCQLYYDRPPIITRDLSTWRVNLPWLEDAQRTIPDFLTMSFLVRSRVTFTLNEFFQVMESGDAKAIVDTTHRLCTELVKVYDEWPISQLLRETVQQEGIWWKVCEVCLDGYASIIMMLSKASKIDTPPSPSASSSSASPSSTPISSSSTQGQPLSPLMMDVTRRYLTLVGSFLAVFSHVPTVSLIFGFYRCYISIGNLARRVLAGEADGDGAEDARILERISVGVDRASRNCKDMQPLTVALKDISRAVHQHLGIDHGA